MTISFFAMPSETTLINRIARRWSAMNFEPVPRSISQIEMDILTVHANGNALRLEELLDADTPNFVYDMVGIVGNLNRKTGKLECNFVPRFSK